MSPFVRCSGETIAVAWMLVAVSVPVMAQSPAPDAPPRAQVTPAEPAPVPPAEPAPSQQPSASRPGLIDALSGFVKDSVEGAQKSIESLNERVGEVNRNNAQTAKDAVEGLTNRLPGSHVVTGRAVCVVAANGAPDCAESSNKLCRDKGYGNGRSLATEQAQNCPARVYLSGRAPRPGDCRLDTYVTQAICQ